MLRAAMLPVSSARPNAVTQVPTFSALEVALAVVVYVVAAVVGTVTAVVVAVPPLAEGRVLATVIDLPVTAVTRPKAPPPPAPKARP
jgi:hypothetical protein